MDNKKRADLEELLDRVIRLESRVVQLMYFLGAKPGEKYDEKQHKPK